ncbi:MAG: mandelate racemase/muconate lactonizing enzyme family protein [Planctomycetales bacterium]|nr:mandelate racemase/muconate lactonizing enzyme family protein [Planctomycetales bacterium]
MAKPTDIRIQEVRHWTHTIDYRTPIKFGGRVVTSATLVNVRVTVETRDGRQGVGCGSMPMGNAWGWPSQAVTTDQTLQALLDTAERYSQRAGELGISGDPLELTHALSEGLASDASVACSALPESMPRLAQLVACSPTDAAIHDAFGKALGQSCYRVLDQAHCNRDLAAYLTPEFAGEYLQQYTSPEPVPSLPLYHLVGALDPLTDADLAERLGDGLPETLGEWILADELTHLKIKLAGDDLPWDVARVAAVERAAVVAQTQLGRTTWCYSLDFNEKCANVEYVLEFLAKLAEASPAALERVQYIEQPTHRDLRANPENRMHEAAKIKPVVIDESLVDLESLQLAREQGYSGVALKACKGHSEALLMGAAAQKYGLFLCVQDLTCVGASFLHSASLAARVPTVAAIEGNGRQYCPAGNAPWAAKFPGMFQIRGGRVQTSELNGPGLGGWSFDDAGDQ